MDSSLERMQLLSAKLAELVPISTSECFKADEVLLVVSGMGLRPDQIGQTEWLLNVPLNMFIQAEPEAASDIWKYRRAIGLADQTFIHAMELRDSPYYVHRSAIEASKQHAIPMITSWSKMDAIKRAIQMNLFDSKAILYLDLNLPISVQDHRSSYQLIKSIAENVPTDRIRMLASGPMLKSKVDFETYFKDPAPTLNDSLIAGPIDLLDNLVKQFDANLVRALNVRPTFGSQILYLNYLENSDQFSLYYGPKTVVLSNYLEYRDGADGIVQIVRQCRDRDWVQSIAISQGLINSLEQINLAPLSRIQLMDELILSCWYGYKRIDISKLAGAEIVALFKAHPELRNERTTAHYNGNLRFMGLSLDA